MLTKWGKIFVATHYTSINSGDGQIIPPLYYGDPKKGYIKAKATDGTEGYFCGGVPYIQNVIRANMTNGNGGIAIGSGDTPATEDDYTLDSVITSGFSASNPTYSTVLDTESGEYTARLQFTINNTGSEDLVIKEICLYRVWNYSATIGATANLGNKPVMVDRTVLDEPVVIAAGTPGIINYDFKYPGNEPEPGE